jgi:hypothetical protein
MENPENIALSSMIPTLVFGSLVLVIIIVLILIDHINSRLYTHYEAVINGVKINTGGLFATYEEVIKGKTIRQHKRTGQWYMRTPYTGWVELNEDQVKEVENQVRSGESTLKVYLD